MCCSVCQWQNVTLQSDIRLCWNSWAARIYSETCNIITTRAQYLFVFVGERRGQIKQRFQHTNADSWKEERRHKYMELGVFRPARNSDVQPQREWFVHSTRTRVHPEPQRCVYMYDRHVVSIKMRHWRSQRSDPAGRYLLLIEITQSWINAATWGTI